MDLRHYLAGIRKSWWIVATALVLGVSLSTAYNSQAAKVYASSVTFFVSTPSGDGTSPLAADQFATRRITSYVGLLTSDIVAERVIATTGVDLSISDVTASITGEADLNTVLLTATVKDSDPERSLVIAKGIASQFSSVVNSVDPIGPGQVVLRVISGPTLNPVPVSPKEKLNLLVGIALGAMAGIVVALLRQVLDTTIRRPQDLREVSGAPVIGLIPFEKDAKKKPLLVNGSARSIRSEAIRHLRTNLQFVDVERPVKVLVVTSSVAGEGKSTTATNLALAFANSGIRTLLIEADLRRPRVSDYLGLERAIGLTNVLAGQVRFEDAVQPWGEAALSVLPSGSIPPNPSELLGSPRMLDLLVRLRRTHDLIVIDTPPLLPVTDAAVVAAHADGAVLVVRYGKSTKGQVKSAVNLLISVEARVLGCVLNMTPRRGSDGYESYGYGYYEEPPQDGDSSKPMSDSSPGSAELNGAGVAPSTQPYSFRLPNAPSTQPSERKRSMRMNPGAASANPR